MTGRKWLVFPYQALRSKRGISWFRGMSLDFTHLCSGLMWMCDEIWLKPLWSYFPPTQCPIISASNHISLARKGPFNTHSLPLITFTPGRSLRSSCRRIYSHFDSIKARSQHKVSKGRYHLESFGLQSRYHRVYPPLEWQNHRAFGSVGRHDKHETDGDFYSCFPFGPIVLHHISSVTLVLIAYH